MHLKIPPALQVAIIAGIMWIISRFTNLNFDFTGKQTFGWIVFYIGIFIAILGVLNFKRAKTTVNPLKPSEASNLVISGIYKFTRNPMYLGMLFVLIAFFIKIGNYLNVPAIVLYVWYMTTYQIKPEEKALENNFGQEYINYCNEVRRWI